MFDGNDVFGSNGGEETHETPGGAAPDTSTDTSGAPGQSVGEPGGGTPPEEWDVPGMGRVNRDELIRGYLRQQDYSRKTQQLSQREREYVQTQQQAAQMEAALQQVRGFLSDRAKIAAYLQQMPGGEPQFQPDQILTAAEAQQLLAQKLGESEQNALRRMQQFRDETLQATYQTQYEQAIDNRLRDIQGRHPELVRVPGMEMLLRQAVASQRPASIDDALSLFDQAASFYSERLRGLAKTVATQPNNPLNRGIQPPSTGAPAPQGEPTNFTGVKDPNLRGLVMQDLEALLARSNG
jgi:hypothetical protein